MIMRNQIFHCDIYQYKHSYSPHLVYDRERDSNLTISIIRTQSPVDQSAEQAKNDVDQ
jgi:hypothetical protein